MNLGLDQLDDDQLLSLIHDIMMEAASRSHILREYAQKEILSAADARKQAEEAAEEAYRLFRIQEITLIRKGVRRMLEMAVEQGRLQVLNPIERAEAMEYAMHVEEDLLAAVTYNQIITEKLMGCFGDKAIPIGLRLSYALRYDKPLHIEWEALTTKLVLTNKATMNVFQLVYVYRNKTITTFQTGGHTDYAPLPVLTNLLEEYVADTYIRPLPGMAPSPKLTLDAYDQTVKQKIEDLIKATSKNWFEMELPTSKKLPSSKLKKTVNP